MILPKFMYYNLNMQLVLQLYIHLIKRAYMKKSLLIMLDPKVQ